MDFQNPTRRDKIADRLLHHGLARPLYRNYAAGLDLSGGEVVLELGSGSGALTRHLAPRLHGGGRVVCVEPSAAWAEVARKRLRGVADVEWHVGEVLALDGEGRFDAAVVHFVLHEIAAAERQPTLNAVARLMKQDARLFLREPTKPRHGVSPEQVRALMAQAGLKEVAGVVSKHVFLPPMYAATFARA